MQFIVIDTNVLASAAILPNSATAQIFSFALEHYVLAQNNATWLELATRLYEPKFDPYFIPATKRIEFLNVIARVSQFFDVSSEIKACRDSDDDKFIGLALDAGAKIIISGDKDLTSLGAFQDIEILTPAQFSLSLTSSPK